MVDVDEEQAFGRTELDYVSREERLGGDRSLTLVLRSDFWIPHNLPDWLFIGSSGPGSLLSDTPA